MGTLRIGVYRGLLGMDEKLIFGIVGAILFGLIGLWLSGILLGVIGAFGGFYVGLQLPGWLKRKA